MLFRYQKHENSFFTTWNSSRGIQAYLFYHALLYCSLLSIFVNITIFRNWGFVTTLRWASLSTPFFPTAFAHFVSVSRSVNSQSISNFFITIIFVMVIYDEWSLMLLCNYFAAPWRRQTWLFKNLWMYLLFQLNNAVIVSGGQRRDSAIPTHVSILPQTPLPSRLPHDTEQTSLC